MKKLDKKEKIKLLKLWIKNLRSGEYKQTTSELRGELDGGVGYCCLGVFMETVNEMGICNIEYSNIKYSNKKELFPDGFKIGNNKYATMPPKSILKLLLLDKEYPFTLHKMSHKILGAYLAEINDDGTKKFKDIATLLEKKLLPILEKK